MKLVVPHSTVGFTAFADFYRYSADRTQPAPLIIWVGGAISLEKYEQRRATEPIEILTEFAAARARLSDAPCDLLVLSAPSSLMRLNTCPRQTLG